MTTAMMMMIVMMLIIIAMVTSVMMMTCVFKFGSCYQELFASKYPLILTILIDYKTPSTSFT